MSNNESSTTLPVDLELVQYILEGAEIPYDEIFDNGSAPIIMLENGVNFYFDENSKLTGILNTEC